MLMTFKAFDGSFLLDFVVTWISHAVLEAMKMSEESTC